MAHEHNELIKKLGSVSIDMTDVYHKINGAFSLPTIHVAVSAVDHVHVRGFCPGLVYVSKAGPD